MLTKGLFMQEVDGARIYFDQLTFCHQLIKIVAGGIALHGKTPGQVARRKDLAYRLWVEKIRLIAEEGQQFFFAHRLRPVECMGRL